jgi:hypothetical protein
MKTTTSLLVAGALGALAIAAPAAAQSRDGQFAVTTRGGYIDWGRATSLQGAPFIGLDADYALHRFVSLGTSLLVARPNTRGEDFLTTQTYGLNTSGDTTFVYGASQAVSIVNGELLATLRYPVNRFTPFLAGGVGMYGMFMDPQVSGSARRANGMSGTLGGGVAVRLSERAGLQFDVRNLTFFDYDRLKLDPTNGRNSYAALFGEDFAAPPSRSSRVNSLVFTLGFRYIPGGGVDDGPRDPNLPREDQR